ncbi:MAG: hypothetical protein GKR94_33300 [Gammaproteobacteria bacterium]|nr:hypothetical protein [Gammaproteobacteria bacterium]
MKKSKRKARRLPPKALKAVERGLRALQAGDMGTAETALRTAVKIAPRYEEGCFQLALLMARTGRLDAATQLVRETVGGGTKSARICALQTRLLTESAALDEALEAALMWSRLAPDDSEALVQVGRLQLRCGDYNAAAAAFGSALDKNPGWLDGHFEHALALLQAGRDDEVRAVLEHVLAAHRGNLAVTVNVSVTYRLLGDVERAMAIIKHAETLAPDDVDVLQNLGLSYMDTGDIDKAEVSFEKALVEKPSDAGIWYNRVRVRRFSAGDEDIVEALERAVMMPGRAPLEQATAEFALGKVLNDLGHYEKAFARFGAGNRLRAQLSKYDPQAAVERARRIMDTWPDAVEVGAMANPTTQVPTFQAPTLVLIVGMPRSGTTLVEQILSRHPAIHAAGEQRQLPSLIQQLQRLQEGEYPEVARLVSAAQWCELRGEQQRKLARRAGGKPLITDKLPTNFEHLGLATHVYPGVRIIHCRRNAMDTCFANYIQFFTEGHDYAYDLRHIAHYYRLYRELMSHWEQTLIAPMLHVDYEAVVDDLPAEARRLVDFLGLGWEPACAEHTGARRAVATASNWQVRQPIYQDAKYRWKRYGALLTPLQEALREYAVN